MCVVHILLPPLPLLLDDDNVTVECIMSEYEVSPLHISQKYVLGIMGFRCPSSTYH